MPTQQACTSVSAAAVREAEDWAAGVLQEWGVRSALARAWTPVVREVAGECTLVLEYDEAAGLLAVDLWQEDRRVWGLDDWIG